MTEKVLLVFASKEERQTAAVLEQVNAPFAVGHLEQPQLLFPAVEKIRPSIVVFYMGADTKTMLDQCHKLRAKHDSYQGLVVFFFPRETPGSMEITLDAGVDGMLIGIWSPEELIVRINSLLKVGFVNRENSRRSRALAQASAEAADIIIQLEEASRKINEQNLCITAQQEKISAHLEKVEHELRIASLLQISLLPSSREFSEGNQIILRDRYIPATDLGGDYFDYLRLPNGNLFVCIADVTGHGVAPALVSVQLRALARSHLLSGQDLAAMMSDLNTFMYETFQQEYLMTMASLCFTPATGVIEFSGAGHCPLIHYIAAEDKCIEHFSRGLPLGVMEDNEFPASQFCLAPGDWLLIYSDGITEANNSYGEEYSPERLQKSFLENIRKGETEIPSRLLERVQEFTHEATFADDVTLVTMQRPV